MINKFKNTFIKQADKNKNIYSEEIGFNRVKKLIYSIKNGNAITQLKNEMQMHFNNPIVAVANLTMSFMNLATSIKTYYDNSVEFDDKTRNFKQKISEINYFIFII